MKNALIWGFVIGLLSAAWLFITHALGYDTYNDKTAPFEYLSILIPVIGLLLGIKSYRDNECKGQMGFLEALIQSFKILLFGGILAVFVAIAYINYIQPNGGNFMAFSGRMFGALLVGLLSALGVSLVWANKSNKID
ncbi:DUF4199 domain-containing protein [Mucilaginibacter ximonensis]|uniref:DUF4199 domain-containing protein n=1 Tax=Mucilaginibacter ximonensis TaxID=538021 RepID=A0ABW5YBM1_9SPHI